MVYFEARSLRMHLANAAAGITVLLLVAFIGLNVATGCGQGGGTCVGVSDLTAPAPQMVAMAAPQGRTTLR